mmetsp:Transcript_36694/g.63004  ORF Transcript_36694/g.63004 Transcript_36694/m.63004 type:complete len:862 (+) Transcript_36694:53-2638(+)
MPRKAFEENIIVDKLPLKLESLEIWKQRIILGTEPGVLLMYDVYPDQIGTGRFQVQIKEPIRGFAKKSIMQLKVIREETEHPLLLSLSDSSVHVHYVPSFKYRETIKGSRGCHLFAVNESGTNITLSLAFKRKIAIFALTSNGFVERKEFNIGEPARTMTWCNGNLCIGSKSRYQLIDMQTYTARELFGPAAMRGIPSACLLPDKMLLTVEKNIGVFLDFGGNNIPPGITWSDTPSSVEYHYPYLIGTLPRAVEVQSLFEGSKSAVQQISMRAKLVVVKDDIIYVASPKEIMRLVPIPLVDQIDELVRIKSYDEALTLLKHLPVESGTEDSKQEQIKHTRYLCANHLFEKQQYKESMTLFLELNCSPLKVLRLYPEMLPQNMQKQQQKQPIKLDGYAEKASLQALVNYLQKVRDPNLEDSPSTLREDYDNTTDINEIIDTSMLRACVKANDPTIYDLLNTTNRCNLKESIKILTAAERTDDLVALYKTKHMHQKALEILTNLGKKRGNGTIELVRYLKSLGKENIDLILKFSIWPLEETPAQGIEIFMEDRPKEKELPPNVILNHIKTIRNDAAKKITVPYLEWLVQEKKEENPDFHNELALEYLNKVADIKKRTTTSSENRNLRAAEERGRLGEIRRLLVEFLEKSKHYTPEKLLPTFMAHNLYEERAILLSRLHEHKEALNSYVHYLGDNQLAEEYCDKHYSESNEDKDVYLHLLTVYLSPPKDEKPMLEAALNLLNKYYNKINAAEALAILPSDIPIHEMYDYFEAVFRFISEKKRNSQVISQLLRSENLQVRQEMIHETSSPIKIDDDTDCPVCGRSITGTSAFAHYPNGTVVHYGCCKDSHVCPKTGTNFKDDKKY